VESRLVPVNAFLDLALADGLNPAPLADAGWAVAALEVPVRVSGETVVCDVVFWSVMVAGHIRAASPYGRVAASRRCQARSRSTSTFSRRRSLSTLTWWPGTSGDGHTAHDAVTRPSPGW
jgi:hypothetical protein